MTCSQLSGIISLFQGTSESELNWDRRTNVIGQANSRDRRQYTRSREAAGTLLDGSGINECAAGTKGIKHLEN